MKKLFYDFDFEKSVVTITGSLLSAGRRLYAHPTGRVTFCPGLLFGVVAGQTLVRWKGGIEVSRIRQ